MHREKSGLRIGATTVAHLAVQSVVVALLFALLASVTAAEWHEEKDVRWAELAVPSTGHPGFTLLPPETTGLFFTNSLAEWSSATNRVLENGCGVAVGDYDNDGRPDIFLCSLQGRSALYRNLGNWKFADMTLPAGIDVTNYVCRGAVFADLNGDGRLDLLISTLGHGVLCFLNEGQGRFTNVTASAGTETPFGSTTLALADVDGDGTLDLYVTNYRSEDIRDRSRVEIRMVNGRMMLAPWYQDRLILTDTGILEFGEPDILYLNDGQGHFRSVSWTGGAFQDETGRPLERPPKDWGLTATFRDLNGDGFPDLYVCNDYWTPDRIWINDGHGHFRAISPLAIRHTSENSMGVDVADVDRDGYPDLLVLDMVSRDPSMRKRQALAQTKMPVTIGEISNRPQIMRNTLFHNRGDGTFGEVADYCGLPASDWSWQPVFLDVDLDGYEDLIIPAGHRLDVQDLDATFRIQSLQHPWPRDMNPQVRQEAFWREKMQHARLYPPLEMPIVTFRNLGNLHFQETTGTWGTSAIGIHQGIAFGDFDGDGDLDFVVNNLNGVCGVYRNESNAPRVAVRLKGLRPNTQGIGAHVTLRGGAIPVQGQEVVCGGRYLSGFDPLLVFAAGKIQAGMTLEVKWRSGKRSVVPQIKPNRVYEIAETGAQPDTERPATNPPAFFQDVSNLISHKHVENSFDDFARQPLLHKRLSQLGPGIGWFDLNGDGHEDLIIGSGAGGFLGVFLNDGRGGFKQMTDLPIGTAVNRDQTGLAAMRDGAGESTILGGSSNYEDGQPAGGAVQQYNLSKKILDDTLPGQAMATGPLALADIDGDGNLDLFVGGRVIPGRYPEAASSRIYRRHGRAWLLDEPKTQLLANVGLVSGAVWSDLDGDGFPELILACEWGPIRILKNKAGRLHDATAQWGLDQFTGWWAGVTTGDFDGDGRMDIVAANWGLNSPYHADSEHPLRLYYGDFSGRGTIDLLETEYDPRRQALVPRCPLDVVAEGLPALRERFSSFKDFGQATMDEVLTSLRGRPQAVEAHTLASMLFLNRGDHFQAVPLPPEAQFAPAFSVNVGDFDGDGCDDVFLSQNFFALPWRSHRLDAGRGLWLQGDGAGNFKAVPGQRSGIEVYGEQRGAALADFNEDGRVDLAITQNGAATKLYLNTGARPGLRVRLAGSVGNPTGVGAVLRLKFGERFGPAREIHAGSGYWSQDSAIQVMATPTPPSAIQVRWPGGKTTSSPVPAGARQIIIDLEGRVQRAVINQ